MKKITFLLAAIITMGVSAQDLVLTGVFDGPLPGGLPKAIEIYAINDIADLSTYGIGSANNGGGSDGVEFAMTGAASAGDYIYIATEDVEFENYFGFTPNLIAGGAAAINGDDAIELYANVVDDGEGNLSGDVIDTFGDLEWEGDPLDLPWNYLDGWAYRVDDTGPDGATFVLDNWTYSGTDANDDETSNDTAANPWPLGTFTWALSVGENNLQGFSLYPNPANGVVTIQTLGNDTVSVAVFDILGKQVLVQEGNTFDVSALKAGMYMVQVSNGTATAVKKLMVK